MRRVTNGYALIRIAAHIGISKRSPANSCAVLGLRYARYKAGRLEACGRCLAIKEIFYIH